MAFKDDTYQSNKNMFVTKTDKPWVYTERIHILKNQEKSLIGKIYLRYEDQTVGELLKYNLSIDPNVLNSGYVIPHPLEPKMTVHCQTNTKTTPPKAVHQALENCILQIDEMEKQIKKLFSS